MVSHSFIVIEAHLSNILHHSSGRPGEATLKAFSYKLMLWGQWLLHEIENKEEQLTLKSFMEAQDFYRKSFSEAQHF